MEKINRDDIFKAIELERARQDRLHPMPAVKQSENADINAIENLIVSSEFLAVLVEEVGEVGSALQGEGDLKAELIQVAATATRWLENLRS